VRLCLHDALHRTALQKRVAILIDVTNLAREVVEEILADESRHGEPIANACICRAASRNDASVVIGAITNSAADLPVLRRARTCRAKQDNPVFEGHDSV